MTTTDEVCASFDGRITLKSVKVNKRLSEETICFSATVYLDGVRMGEATNRGHGGANMLHFFHPIGDPRRSAWEDFQEGAGAAYREAGASTFRRPIEDMVNRQIAQYGDEKETKGKVIWRKVDASRYGEQMEVRWPEIAKAWRDPATRKEATEAFVAHGMKVGWFLGAGDVVFINDEVADRLAAKR